MNDNITKEDYKFILKSLNESEKIIKKLLTLFVTTFIGIVGYFGKKFIETESTQFLDIGLYILFAFIIFMMIVSFLITIPFNKDKQERQRLKEQLEHI